MPKARFGWLAPLHRELDQALAARKLTQQTVTHGEIVQIARTVDGIAPPQDEAIPPTREAYFPVLFGRGFIGPA